MTTVNSQKLVAQDMLSFIQRMDPHCIVAGGAPRDWYLNQLATDIDVFMYCPADMMAKGEFTSHIARLTGISGMRCLGREDSTYCYNPNLIQVVEGAYNGEKVQFMRMAKPTWHITDDFPINISQCWYKGRDVQMSNVARHGFDKQALIQVSGPSELSGLQHDRYIAKIRAKFPDWPFYRSMVDYHMDSPERGGPFGGELPSPMNMSDTVPLTLW